MQAKKTETVFGIIFKRKPANEADVFARILSQNEGLFSIAVKGALRPKSKLNSATLNLSYGEYTVFTNHQGISNLRTTAKTKQFENIFLDLQKNAYALYFLDLADHAFVDYEPVGTTFDLIFSVLNLLNDGTNPDVLLALTQLQMLPVFGVGPELKECLICHKTQGIFDYSIELGGVICSDHFKEVTTRMYLKPKTTALIRTLGLIDVQKVGSINLSPELVKSTLKAIDQIYQQTLDLNLKTRAFIDSLDFIWISFFSVPIWHWCAIIKDVNSALRGLKRLVKRVPIFDEKST